MAWVRIDENFAQHPKVVRAGPLGMAMQVAALCYCNRNLTDGFVPKQIACNLLDLCQVETTYAGNDMVGVGGPYEWDMIVEDLVRAGLWIPVEGGWLIHDYHDYQPSRQQIQALSKARSRAGKRGAKAKQSVKQKLSKPSANAQQKSAPYPGSVSPNTLSPNGDNDAASRVMPDESLKDQIWGPCLRWLAKQSEKPPDKLRPLLGKWCKAHGEGAVLEAMQRAERQSPVDPVSWLAKALQANGGGSDADVLEMMREAAREADRRNGIESGS